MMAEDAEKSGALIVAAHGQRGILETPDGHELPYIVKGKRLRVVCGDRVNWVHEASDATAIVTYILNRNNVLERSGRGETGILAANLTCLIVVFAPLPKPDWFLVDRYLCAGALMGCRLLLLGNKNDLDADRNAANTAAEIRAYIGCGYEIVSVSAKNPDSLGVLRAALQGEIGILVGQSGVGKSSLINQLVPDARIRVSAISKATSEGKHTTTASAMHPLPDGGRLIDTPGVREFIPMIADPPAVQAGYPEILSAAHGCRFRNCRHLREPDCAVQQAVDAGQISERRYESYKRLLRSLP